MEKTLVREWNKIQFLTTRKKNQKIIFDKFEKKEGNSFKKIINEDQSYNFLNDYRHNLKFAILKSNRDEMVLESFEMSLPHANSFRRILLGEINTAAIDKVFFYSNSSILNDETIAHRLGLIPIMVNSKFLTEFKTDRCSKIEKVILELKIKNSQKSSKSVSAYSKSLKLKKYGLFFSMHKNLPIYPVFRDILILKLNPGQKIKCECHCVVGSGIKHAKFSPVGTAFYRISPKVKIVGEILGIQADKLFEVCPVKIFNIKQTPGKFNKSLRVENPQFCTLCKECLKIKVGIPRPIRISRIKNKLTFVIESTGVLSPEILFHRAIILLVGKCNESLSILFKSFTSQ
jgi:DNA-directed RNA polymerase I and III subunit RPAC1